MVDEAGEKVSELLLGRVCKVKLRADPTSGWKMVIGDDPSCEGFLRQVSENLGTHGKIYLAKRIEPENDSVKEMLRRVGLVTSR